MKTFILTITLAALSGMATAQKLIGIRGGLNYNNLAITSSGTVDQSKSLNSFHAGITANLPLLIFSLQPSLLVTGKGSEVTHGDVNSDNYYVAKTNPIYLEVPVTFNLNFRLGPKTGIFLGAGPYAAMGIAGRTSSYGKTNGTSFSTHSAISYSDDNPKTWNVDEGAAYGKLRKYDYGVTMNAGVFLHGIMFSAFYDFGIPKINSLSNSNQSDNFRNKTLGLSAGIMFGG